MRSVCLGEYGLRMFLHMLQKIATETKFGNLITASIDHFLGMELYPLSHYLFVLKRIFNVWVMTIPVTDAN